MRPFGPVAAAQGFDDAHDLAALFKSCGQHRAVHVVRQQWVGGDENVGSRHQHTHEQRGQSAEELLQASLFRRRQHRETGNRAALRAVKARRYAPNAAGPILPLVQLVRLVFDQSIRRVRYDRMDGCRFRDRQPLEGIGQDEVGIAGIIRRDWRSIGRSHRIGGVGKVLEFRLHGQMRLPRWPKA